ncbi:hypothetical protein HMPREF9073_01280 [Capnocytophaga sp. oral taxon 326 str. F0382]|nr:hypothetical protein HMPREF9073_01280 [Capnocytophaga sp. oral taxon 326 str. F0382]
MTPKKTLKKWFSNLMKPAQEHFAAWIDSYWHKSEQIPMSNIDGLSRAIENTASAKQLLNHLEDTNAHRALFDELKRQIQAIQTILQVDDVNLDTLQEIVTELKANTKLQELIDKKVNKEEGKGLSSNDFTNELKQKLEGLQPTDVSGLLPKGGYDGSGQQLKEAIDGLQTKIGQVETTLSVDDTAFDTLQEIVTQVKSNKNLETLLTEKVDKTALKEELIKAISSGVFLSNLYLGTNEGEINAKERLKIYGGGEGSVLELYTNKGYINIGWVNTIDLTNSISLTAQNIILESNEIAMRSKKIYRETPNGNDEIVFHSELQNELEHLSQRIAALEAKEQH